MDESLTGIMTIIGPLILLFLLAWLVMRSRRGPNQTTDTTRRTEQATRDNYAAEEESRRAGTDNR